MARYKLIIGYDGTDFHGYQRQRNERTIQAVLEGALFQLNWTGKAILSAGRTDTGVHASGQVVALDLNWVHPADELLQALNAHLPLDVSVKEITLTNDEFHPRYDADSRTYQYSIYNSPTRDPLKDRYAWRVWPRMEKNLLSESARLFLGAHDFSSFGSAPKKDGSTERWVFDTHWAMEGDEYLFEITANAFLYHMVRRIVFLEVMVGLGKLGVMELQAAIDDKKVLKSGIAPACGLTLKKVNYQHTDYQE